MQLSVNENGLPILDQYSDEGFIDCVFKITDLEEAENLYRFNVLASYKDIELGFGVEVVKGIKAGFDADASLVQAHVYKNGVKFIRTGTQSDALISVLASLYGFGEVSLQMTDEETFTAIALHQGEIDMRSETIKMKIFGKDQDDNMEENYFESFFNLDLKNGLVFWNEKDQDYRAPLIRGLSS